MLTKSSFFYNRCRLAANIKKIVRFSKSETCRLDLLLRTIYCRKELKTMVKKILCTLTVFALVSVMLVASVAAHTSPITDLPCNNTGRTHHHSNFLTSGGSAGTHDVIAAICRMENRVYNHNTRCSSCTALVGTTSLMCRRTHSHSGCSTERINSSCR